MLRPLGIAVIVFAGLTVAQTFGVADDLRPSSREAAAAIATEAQVPLEAVRDVRCTRRPSRVFGNVFACRANAGGADVNVVLTSFDGQWTVAGR
jgi:hypothetical protein